MEDMNETQPQFQNSVDVKLDYLQRDIREIKGDVKDIKNDYVSRREYMDGLQSVRKEFNDANTLLQQGFTKAIEGLKEDMVLPKRITYGAVALICITVLGAMVALVIVK